MIPWQTTTKTIWIIEVSLIICTSLMWVISGPRKYTPSKNNAAQIQISEYLSRKRVFLPHGRKTIQDYLLKHLNLIGKTQGFPIYSKIRLIYRRQEPSWRLSMNSSSSASRIYFTTQFTHSWTSLSCLTSVRHPNLSIKTSTLPTAIFSLSHLKTRKSMEWLRRKPA